MWQDQKGTDHQRVNDTVSIRAPSGSRGAFVHTSSRGIRKLQRILWKEKDLSHERQESPKENAHQHLIGLDSRPGEKIDLPGIRSPNSRDLPIGSLICD